MREIKFRIRRDMLDVFDKYVSTEWQYFTAIEGCMDEENCYMETVGQYTGLKDKNGVEIYEGDIVNCTRTTIVTNFKECEVVYSKYYAGFSLKVPEDNGDFIYIELHRYKNDYLEVVGNIHEEEEK